MSPTSASSGLSAARRLLLLLTFSLSLLTFASAHNSPLAFGFTYPNVTALEDNGLTYYLGEAIKFDWNVPFRSVNLAFVAQDAGSYQYLAYRWLERTFTWTVNVNGSNYRKPYFFMYIENAENPREHFWSARFRVKAPHYSSIATTGVGSGPGPYISSKSGPIFGGNPSTSVTSTSSRFPSGTAPSSTSTSGASQISNSTSGISTSGTSATTTTLSTGSAPPAVATPGDGKPGDVQPGDASTTGANPSAGAPWNGVTPSGGLQNGTAPVGTGSESGNGNSTGGNNGNGNGDSNSNPGSDENDPNAHNGGTTTESSGGISTLPTDAPTSTDPDPSATTTTSATAEANATEPPEVRKSLSAGQAAGAVVGAIGGAALLSAVAFFVYRQRARHHQYDDEHGSSSSESGGGGSRHMHQTVSEPILEDSTVYAGAEDPPNAYHGDAAWTNRAAHQRGYAMWPAPLQPHQGPSSVPGMTQLQQSPASALTMNPPTPGGPLVAGATGPVPREPPLSAAPRYAVSHYTLGRYNFDDGRGGRERQNNTDHSGSVPSYYMGYESDEYHNNHYHEVQGHNTPWFGMERR